MFIDAGVLKDALQAEFPDASFVEGTQEQISRVFWCLTRSIDGAHLFAPPKTSHYMSLLYYHIVEVQGSCELPILFFGTAC